MKTQNFPIAEKPHTINGVSGRMYPIHEPQTVRGRLAFRAQKWVNEARPVKGYGTNGRMHVEIRFDDECKNGHQTFAITATVRTRESDRVRDIAAGGCLHDEIRDIFPELAPLIRWHLTSTDEPMHYPANAVYLAGNQDHNRRTAGQPSAWQTVVYFGDYPFSHKVGEKFAAFIQARTGTGDFQVVAIAHENRPGDTYKFGPKFTFAGFGEKWHECPFDDEHTAREWVQALNTLGARFERVPTAYSEGKAHQLDAARRAAAWPDATDEQLCAEPEILQAALTERLPALLAQFRADMEAAGFMWEPEQTTEGEK